ncbi:MAG: hypothetical protein KKH28_00055 [Elusimicrobia bacterium]|nr:hypothetical protein [Elusimicrobiota bacterium]
MHTKSDLGEFVQRDGELYFVRSKTVNEGLDKINFLSPAGASQSGDCLQTWLGALVICISAVVIMLALLLAVLFPMFLFAILIGSVALKHIQKALR